MRSWTRGGRSCSPGSSGSNGRRGSSPQSRAFSSQSCALPAFVSPRIGCPKARPRGASASAPRGPNEIWHLDATILKLLDGSTAYLHAVIDNFSRKILAWTVRDRLEPAATCDVLFAAARNLDSPGPPPVVVADSGVENLNAAVDAALAATRLRRVLAQIEVTFSNSIIEAWWRSLKHQWLYLNTLDSIARLRDLVAFFVEAHNSRMPHSAFLGQTPDEKYFGTAPNLPDELAAARTRAIEARLAANRALSCDRCSGGPNDRSPRRGPYAVAPRRASAPRIPPRLAIAFA